MMDASAAKTILAVLIFGLMLAPSVSLSDEAKETMEKTGSRATIYVGPGQTYTSIQSAILAASDGDTIRVLAGTYYEQVNLVKRLNIIGSGPNNTTIDGQKLGSVVVINHEECEVSGFLITNANPMYMYSGIEITEDNATVIDCEIINSPNGIIVSGSNFSITDCYIHDNNNYGISIEYIDNATIRNCVLNYNSHYNIRVESSENINIMDSFLNRTGIGIQFESCRTLTVRDTEINNSYTGMTCLNSKVGSIFSCDFGNLEPLALLVSSSEDLRIINNTFFESYDQGIDISSSQNITVEGNDLKDTGIRISGTEIHYWNTHHISQNNTVAGKPLFYLVDTNQPLVPPGFGEYILANCTNIAIRNIVLMNNTNGIIFGFCDTAFIENVTTFSILDYGLYLYKCKNSTIQHCMINVSRNKGIQMEHCISSRIVDSTFYYNQDSIELCSCDRIAIENCTFYYRFDSGAGVAIGLSFTSNTTIMGCDIEQPFDGIYLQSSNNNTIKDNSINYACYSAIALVESNDNDILDMYIYFSNNGISLSYSANNLIQNCTVWWSQFSFYTGGGNGIILNPGWDNSIVHCSLVLNDDSGIAIFGGHNNLLEGNILDRNNVGIFFNSLSDNNTVLTNNFYAADYLKGRDDGKDNRWYVDGRGNYWDDSNMLDDDTDLVADLPRQVDGAASSQDLFPLMLPHGALTLLPPENTTAYETVYYEQNLTATGTDLPQVFLDWYLSPEYGWVDYRFSGFDSKSSVSIFGTPSQSDVGMIRYRFSVTDGSVMDTMLVNMTVVNVNTPPTIDIYPPTLFNEDEYYISYCYASDPDSYTGLSWSLESDKDFMSITANGQFQANPTNEDVGPGWMNITVTDPDGLSDSKNITYNVINVNDDPKILTQDVTSCGEFEDYAVQYEAADPDPTNDTLQWGVKTNAPDMKIDPQTGLLTWSSKDYGGYTFWVNISVGDGNGGYDFHHFDIPVADTEKEPEISSPPSTIHMMEDTVDDSLDLTTWFTDPDGDTLEFSYSGNDKINVSSIGYGRVRLTPPKDWSGQETLTFLAYDGRNWVGDDVKVVVEAVNDPPSGVEILFAEQDYFEKQYQPAYGKAQDADIAYGDSLNLTWYGDKVGKIGYGEYVNLSLPPGVHLITLRATDESGAVAIASREITILKDPKNVSADDDDDDDGNAYAYLVPIGILMAVIITIAFMVFVLAPRKKEPAPPPEKIKIPRRVRIDREDLDKYMADLAPAEETTMKEDEEEALFTRLPMPGDVDFTPKPKEEFSEEDLAKIGESAPAQTPLPQDIADVPPAEVPKESADTAQAPEEAAGEEELPPAPPWKRSAKE